MKHFIYIILLGVLASQCRHKEDNFNIIFPGKPEVPTSVVKEHENLLNQIETIALLQDSTGLVAIKLRDMMRHHFREEEEYVLPPLGLLPLLAHRRKNNRTRPFCRNLSLAAFVFFLYILPYNYFCCGAPASGELPTESKDIIRLTEKLKSQLAHMSAEHQLTIAYMDELKQFAPVNNLPKIVQFEKELHEHARLEEEFYFPAAILIGEYLKLKIEVNEAH